MDFESNVRKYLVNFSAAANMVSNVPVANLENYYNLLNEVQISRLLQSQPYLNALFMSSAANTASVSNRSTESNTSVNSSSNARSSNNTASSPISIGSSTGVSRRNIPVNPNEDYQEIELDGHKTPCILVGGEPRIPLLIIENILLCKVKASTLKDTLAEHNIRPVDCTENEYALLRTRIRSSSTKKIQLLTYSLAEFLIRILFHDKGKIISRSDTVEVRPGVRVKGRVFGKQRGFFRSDLYDTPDAQCIECDTCGTYFSPEKFVGHTHQPETRGIVHWGYKPSEWRRYLSIFRDKKNKDLSIQDEARQRDTFQEVLNRFNSPPKTTVQYRRKTYSQTSKNPEHGRKRNIRMDGNDGECSPLKRIVSRDLISETSKTGIDHSDALFAPNVNLGSIPHEGKSAFTPIERREMKEAGFSKEDSMVDRLKKQYQDLIDYIDKVKASNGEKQGLIVQSANLNQGYSTVIASMKNRIIAHKKLLFQAEQQFTKTITVLSTELESTRNENLDMRSQMKSSREESDYWKRKCAAQASQREPVPVKDRILYQNAKDDLEKLRMQLKRSEEISQSLGQENDQLRAQLVALIKKPQLSESQEPQVESNSPDESSDTLDNLKILPLKESIPQEQQQELNIKVKVPLDRNEDSDEIDSAATESAPGGSQPGSPESPVSPFDVIGTVVCSGRAKTEEHSSRELEEDEYGPPTLTREQD